MEIEKAHSTHEIKEVRSFDYFLRGIGMAFGATLLAFYYALIF